MSAPADTRSPLELDRERVSCLLLINTQLIKKAYGIYVNIIGDPQQLQQLPPQTKQSVLEQYQNLSRRVQCNISVLSYISEKYHNKGAPPTQNRIQFPVILSPPPEMPELNNLYRKLQDLYPDALQYLKLKIQQMRYQQEAAGSQAQAPFPGQAQGSPMANGMETNSPMPVEKPAGFNAGFNPGQGNVNFQNMNGNFAVQPTQHIQQTQAQAPSSISPQQILGLAGLNSASFGGVDFFGK